MSENTKLEDLSAQLRVMQSRLSAHEKFLSSLAVAMPVAARTGLFSLLVAQQLSALADDDADAAHWLGLLERQLKALMGDALQANHAFAAQALAAQASLVLQTTPRLQAAMRSWLATASAQELEPDVAGALAQMRAAHARAGGVDAGAARKAKGVRRKK